MSEKEICDLLYLDFDKAASIWSQFEGGLREKISITDDASKGQKAGASFGIPKFAEASIGVDYAGKRSILETKILHHDILNRVDSELTNTGLVVDLMDAVSLSESDPQAIRDAIGVHPYIKASGESVIEDYSHILSISQKFNDIMKFITQCATNSAKNSEAYLVLKSQTEQLNSKLRSSKDKLQKAELAASLRKCESALDSLLQPQSMVLDQWLTDGIKLWITTFMPTRINFRVYPFPQCPSFQVLCNLKRDCFVDQDPEHLLYGYGNRPNVPLTVFGLLTSIPTRRRCHGV